MNDTALTLWLITIAIVGCFCGYFFYRVLTAEKRPEPDSYSGNDDEN